MDVNESVKFLHQSYFLKMNSVIYYVIKLGKIKHFVKALAVEEYYFTDICKKFPNLVWKSWKVE